MTITDSNVSAFSAYREQDITPKVVHEQLFVSKCGGMRQLKVDLCFDEFWDFESGLPYLDSDLGWKLGELRKEGGILGRDYWEWEWWQ